MFRKPLASFAALFSLQAGLSAYTLQNYTAMSWWYGCAPTTGGMWLAYYDTNGYKGQSFSNLIPGTTGSYISGAYNDTQVLRRIVASEEHQRDYYNAGTYGYDNGGGEYLGSDNLWHTYGYNESGDDSTTTSHADNCLADLMGASRDAFDLSNGATYILCNDDGSRLYGTDRFEVDGYGPLPTLLSGVGEFIQNQGYGIAWCYAQYSDLYMQANSLGGGFTFTDYVAEIDASRPVAVYFYGTGGGHFMLGIGYDAASESIICLNTWNDTLETIGWDESFHDMSLAGAMALELAVVPEPAQFGLGAGVAGLVALARLRRRQRTSPGLA